MMNFSIRIPVLILFCLSIVASLYLGLASIKIPHDKAVHVMTFLTLTTEFYFIFDTNHKSLKLLRYITFFVCSIGGAVFSEFFQKLVNSKRVFDPLDIVSNIAGSVMSLVGTYIYEQFTRRNRRRTRQKNLSSNLRNDTEETETGNYDTSDTQEYVAIQLKDMEP